MIGKTTIIFNPRAKSEKAGVLWYEMYKVAPKAKIKLTKGPGNATRKAAKAVANGSQIVVAAGGDGTINEVLNGIVGSSATLGIIPIGSVNVLARELKIPLTIEGAWKVIEQGSTRLVDLVRIDYHVDGVQQSRHFIQMAGVGLDADIVQKVTWEKKRRWGPLSYVFQSFQSACQNRTTMRVKVDDTPTVEGSFALIGNGSFYGGPFPVFHKASMTDGKLDVCIFKSPGVLNLIHYFQAVVRGRQSSTRGIDYRHGEKVEISADTPVPLQIDGEFIGHLPATFQILPQALRIALPGRNLE